jgi:hypothetical protein
MDVKQEAPPVRFAPPKAMTPPIDQPWYKPPPKVAMGMGMGRGKVVLSALLALGTLLAGAWAAVVTYAAPSFGFPIDSAGAWQDTTHRLVLHMVPGVAAAFCGFVLLVFLPALRRGKGRVMGGLAALVVMGAGAWLLLGRSALAAFTGSTTVDAVQGSPQWAFLLRIAHEWGPGLLLVVFGAWSLGLQAVGKTRLGLQELGKTRES